MDLRVFVVNNGVYGIVDKGLEVIIPDVPKRQYHSKLPQIDFVKAAEAHGWDGVRVAPDLSNLERHRRRRATSRRAARCSSRCRSTPTRCSVSTRGSTT